VVGGFDNGDIVAGHCDRRAHLADLAVLDEDVGLRKIADLAIEREHDSAFEENAACAGKPREFGIDGLCDARRRQQRGCSTSGEHCANLQKAAARRAIVMRHGRPPFRV
jgi:hypothetical protein